MLQLLDTSTETHMNETEPLYFTKFREHIDNKFNKINEKFEGIDKKFETYIPQYFKDFQVHIDKKFDSVDKKFIAIDKKIESEVNGLAVMIKDNFVTKDEFEDKMENMVTKDDIKDMVTKEDIQPILQHIGSYEIRARNIEDILLKDHKPRIIDLEKEVFA